MDAQKEYVPPERTQKIDGNMSCRNYKHKGLYLKALKSCLTL